MPENDRREAQLLILRAGPYEPLRRHAAIFLKKGKYRIDLVPAPDPTEDLDDNHGWTAWGKGPFIHEFHVYCPSFPSDRATEDRRRFFATGGRYTTKAEAIASFMAMPEEDRSFSIDVEYDHQGQPVLFFINDVKDDDNRGGLTLRIVPV